MPTTVHVHQVFYPPVASLVLPCLEIPGMIKIKLYVYDDTCKLGKTWVGTCTCLYKTVLKNQIFYCQRKMFYHLLRLDETLSKFSSTKGNDETVKYLLT